MLYKIKSSFTLLLALAIALFLNPACKRDSNNIPPKTIKCFVTHEHDSFIKYSYDEQGRMTSMDHFGQRIFNITYESNKMIISGYGLYYPANDPHYYFAEYYLDSRNNPTNGKVVMIRQKTGDSIVSNLTYTYNEDGTCKGFNKTGYDTDSIKGNFLEYGWKYEYINGNLTKASRVGIDSIRSTYTHYTDKKESRGVKIYDYFNALDGIIVRPTPNKNPVKNEMDFYNFYSDKVLSFEYTYEFDADGKITKESRTSLPGGGVFTTTYGYICK